MKKSTFLIFLLFSSMNIFAQYSQLDSLKSVLSFQSKRENIETYLNISELPISRDSSIFYLEKALVTAKQIEFDSIYPVQFALASSFYVKGEIERAKKEISKGMSYYTYTNDPVAYNGHILMLLGIFSEALNQDDSTVYYYDKAINVLKPHRSNRSQELISVTYTNYGNFYLKRGQYDNAIKIYYEAIELNKSVGYDKNLCITYNNIAGVFKELKNYDKAIYYYEQALKVAEKIDDIQNIGGIYIGLGEIYFFKQDLDKALSYFLRAVEILETINFTSPLGSAYQDIAELFLVKKDFKNAQLYIEKGLLLAKKASDEYIITNLLITQANLFYETQKSSLGLEVINRAITKASSLGYLNLEKEAIQKKIQILAKDNLSTDLVSDYKRLMIIKDSIYNLEKTKIVNELETKYSVEQKEKENQILRAEKAESELTSQKASIRNWILSFSLIVALLALLSYVQFARQKRKELHYNSSLAILSAKQQEQQEIGMELHDSITKKLEQTVMTLQQKGEAKVSEEIISINSNLREIAKKLSFVDFQESSFSDQIVTLAASYQNENLKINIRGLSNIEWKKIKEPIKYNLYLIIREAISNSYNHSNASNIVVSFSKAKKEVSVSVVDNGEGFEKDKIAYGSGLRNMKVRVKDMNGTININSTPNSGTNVAIQFAII